MFVGISLAPGEAKADSGAAFEWTTAMIAATIAIGASIDGIIDTTTNMTAIKSEKHRLDSIFD